jgi:acyl dehydratase
MLCLPHLSELWLVNRDLDSGKGACRVNVPQTAIGQRLDPISTTIDAGRLRFFAKSIGETNPVYTDRAAAADAGYPDLPVPPTFFFGLKLEVPDPFAWLTGFGVDFNYVLHGTQKFDYARMAFAGDELTISPAITEVYEKKGGALEFVVLESTVTRADEVIVTLVETIVIRHPELEVAR